MEEKSFAFECDALMNEAGGCPSCVLTYYVVEMTRTYIQQSSVVGYLVQRVVSVIDELKRTEGSLSEGQSLDFSGKRVTFRREPV